MAKILFICKRRTDFGNYTSNTYGLLNSATFVSNYLADAGHDARTVIAVDQNEIDKLVTAYDPEYVIIEALFMTPAKLEELIKIPRHAVRKWIIRLHSKWEFISTEGICCEWLYGYADVARRYATTILVAPNDTEVQEYASDLFGLKTVYLPNIYYTDNSYPGKLVRNAWQNHYNKDVLDIACFGSIRPFKNQLVQALAAVKYADSMGKRMNFHINGDRVEGRGEPILKNIRALFAGCPRHTLVEHGWLQHKEFILLVRTMDLGMQVSFTETFNIVSADFVANNVSIVGSSEIPWLPLSCSADPASVDDIVFSMNRAIFNHTLVVEALENYNYNSKNIWNKFLRLYKS